MKDALIAALFIAWSGSVSWWIGYGTNPLQQLAIVGRHLSTSPLWKPFRFSSEHQFARYERSRLEHLNRVRGTPDPRRNIADRRINRRA